MKKNYILTTIVGLLFILSVSVEAFAITNSSTDGTGIDAIKDKLMLSYQDVPITELSGKTIKRIVPSTDGEYLYILAHAGKTPTLLVYNHTTKTVKEVLSTTNCVTGRVWEEYFAGDTQHKRTGDVVSLSDIAVTDDGVLVGIGRSILPYYTEEGVWLYKWENGSDGIATGDAIRWFDSKHSGNYANAEVGEVFAYHGTTAAGYAYYSVRTMGESKKIRWERLTIDSDVLVAHSRANENGNYLHTDLFIDASPFSEQQFLYNSASVDFAEMTMGTKITPIAVNPATPTTMNIAGIPVSARHTPIFTYNGHHYVIGATETGIALADVTDRISTAKAITLSVPKLPSKTTTNAAAVGATFRTNLLGLFVIRDGQISKYSNELSLPEAPVLTASHAYLDSTTAKGVFHWTAPEDAIQYEIAHKVNGNWVIFQGDISDTSIDWEMPDQDSKMWTMKVRTQNINGLKSPWSNEVTLVYVGVPELVGSATMEIDGQVYGHFRWNVPAHTTYFDIQHKVGDTWTDYKMGLDASITSLNEAIPDQTVQTWTVRIRARNNTYASDWSNEATISFAGYDRVFLGTDEQDPYSWSNAANWDPAGVPTIEHDVLIKNACKVDGIAAAKSICLRKGLDYKDVKLTILPTGALTVASTIRQVNDDDRKTVRTLHTASDLIVKADSTGQGTLVQFDPEGKTPATVEVYGMHENGDGRWTILAMPVNIPNAQASFYRSWMMHWNEYFGKWEYVTSYEHLPTFRGYLLTQKRPMTYVLKGTLPASDVQTIGKLTAIGMDHTRGYNMVGNSWTAPLQIRNFTLEDFVDVDATIYIYDYQEPVGEDTAPVGYYRAVSIGTTTKKSNVINPLQAFFVLAHTDDASVRLDYSRLVNHAEQSLLNLHRTPQVHCEEIALRVTGENNLYCDVRLLQQADFTPDFDAGFDGRKLLDHATIPYLAAESIAGDMAILATPEIDGTFLNFYKGSAASYTITFTYDGAKKYQLEDIITGKTIDILTGNTYTFEASEDDNRRFRIVRL